MQPEDDLKRNDDNDSTSNLNLDLREEAANDQLAVVPAEDEQAPQTT